MTINILLASYKGQAYLAGQIESIINQKNVDVKIQISDDGSAASCLQVLNNMPLFAQYKNLMSVSDGPQKGVNANFLHLLHQAKVCTDDLYAFSDQDDIWLSDKLLSAKSQIYMSPVSAAVPVLYMGRTMVCNEKLQPLFLSKGISRSMSFKNALLESVAGGNTMMFNSATLVLLQRVNYAVHHDWLSYMAVMACGGRVIFDDTAYVLYRQHSANVIGASRGTRAKLYRFKKLLSNEFRNWADNNITALSPLFSQMTAENQAIYIGFKRLHEMQGWYYCFHRLALFVKLGLYRQRRVEHWGFMLAAFLGKI